MSFGVNVKTELCKTPLIRACCAKAEAYGVLLYCNTFSFREIRINTASAEFAERLPKLFDLAFSRGFDCASPAGPSGKRSLCIVETSAISDIFAAYGFDAESVLAHHINLSALEVPCCRASFLRGAFLAGGSVTDPQKGYHLELVTDHISVSRELFSILLDMGFEPKDASRGGNYITYFKQSESIEDMLTTMGAPLSAMKVMSAKVEKDMRNAINRRVNCDSANADKVVSASLLQLEAIRRLDIDELPEKLQETALLRIANPDASLADLAALADPPVSKSCLSHRLRRLTRLAAQI